MEKYKICPYCGEHNSPQMLECIQCETDLSTIRVVDDKLEKKIDEQIILKNDSTIHMVRICDCGHRNLVNVRKCENCGEDISDVIPSKEENILEKENQYMFVSLDGKYTYKIIEPFICIGREMQMKEYLKNKMYVSRRHAELIIEANKLYIRNISQTNFTYVNNKKINQEKYELQNGDEVGLGGNIQNGNRQNEAAYFQIRINKVCI